MRSKLSALLLAALLFAPLAFADPVSDPLLGATPRILIASAVSSTQTSSTISTSGRQTCAIQINVATCTTCNMTPVVYAVDQSGGGSDFRIISDGTAITATGVFSYLVGPGVAAGGSFTRAVMSAPMPNLFKVSVIWNSGTNATYNAVGWCW